MLKYLYRLGFTRKAAYQAIKTVSDFLWLPPELPDTAFLLVREVHTIWYITVTARPSDKVVNSCVKYICKPHKSIYIRLNRGPFIFEYSLLCHTEKFAKLLLG